MSANGAAARLSSGRSSRAYGERKRPSGDNAEAALCTSLGIADRTFGFLPRVALALEFRRPLRFNDPVELELSVASVGRSTVRYALALTGPDGLAAEGTITGCLIDGDTKRAIRWPEDMRERLRTGGRQPDAV